MDATVKKHLDALSGEQREIYRLLSGQLVKLAKQKNPDREYDNVLSILREEEPVSQETRGRKGMGKKNTVVTFREAKEKGDKLTMLTAYDYSTAKLIDEAGVNSILVGDSLGNVILGYEDTISVTMEDMIHHGAAVARGAKDALVVIDMPFMSYQTSVYDAVVNAGRLMKEGRAGAVKLEGGEEVCPQIRAIVAAGIPVVAHLGLTPQSINALAALRCRKERAAAKKLLREREP